MREVRQQQRQQLLLLLAEVLAQRGVDLLHLRDSRVALRFGSACCVWRALGRSARDVGVCAAQAACRAACPAWPPALPLRHPVLPCSAARPPPAHACAAAPPAHLAGQQAHSGQLLAALWIPDCPSQQLEQLQNTSRAREARFERGLLKEARRPIASARTQLPACLDSAAARWSAAASTRVGQGRLAMPQTTTSRVHNHSFPTLIPFDRPCTTPATAPAQTDAPHLRAPPNTPA